MSATFVAGQTLSTVTCAKCGVLFAMPEHWDTKLRENHASFFCPAGHSNYYPAKSEAERLREELAREQSRIEHRDAEIRDLRKQRDHAKRQRDGMKGAYRKVAVRVKNGVCPCCKRTFKCLADHMRDKHPDFQSTPPDAPI